MTETDTTLESENAELSENSELDNVAAVVEEIAADDRAESADGTAGADTEEPFEATDMQIELAKQLGYSEDEIAGMDEAEAKAVDKLARLDSRRQQRKGKEKKEVKTTDSAESSTDDDDEFTEDDWFTDDGRKKINAMFKAAKTQNQTKDNTERDRLQADADKAFDSLDPEIFKEFSPGESALIESGSAADEKRTKALAMAKTIQATAQGIGHTLTLEQAIEQSLSIIAPAETEKAALNKANDERGKRGSQRISAPSSRSHKNQKVFDNPHDEAIQKIYDAVNG